MRSFQIPATPGTRAWPPSLRAGEVAPGTGDPGYGGLPAELPLCADLAGDAGDFVGERAGEVAPGTGDPGYGGLPAELPLCADLAGDAGDLVGERRKLVDHRVHRGLELKDFAARVHGDLLREVALRDRGGDVRDVADLVGEVVRHLVDRVGEAAPGPRRARDLRLPAEAAFAADLAGDAGDFVGERGQLVDHRVQGGLELQDFAARVDVDLLREVTRGDGRGDLRDVADLVGEVVGHQVDRVGEVAPGARDARHPRLTAQPSFGADLARDARDLVGERGQLVHHRVDRVLELEDLAPCVDVDLLREVAPRHRGGDRGDVADLLGEVVGEEVDRIGEIAPGAGHAGDLGLPAEAALPGDLARQPDHFRGEPRQLREQAVHRFRQLRVLPAQRTAVQLQRHRLRQVTLGDRAEHPVQLHDRAADVLDQAVHRVDGRGPAAGADLGAHAFGEPAFLAHRAADPHQLGDQPLVAFGDVVERRGQPGGDPVPVRDEPPPEVAVPEVVDCPE